MAQDKAQELPNKSHRDDPETRECGMPFEEAVMSNLVSEFSLRQGETSADLQVEPRKVVREKKL